MSTLIPVAAIEAFKSPFSFNVWKCGIVTKARVKKAIAQGKFLDHEQWSKTVAESKNQLPNQQQHAERIAFLVHSGWNDNIQIDVGVPSLGFIPVWPYTDGNHRICAAIIRSDMTIDAEVSGDIDLASDIFGVEFIDDECAESAA